MVSGSKKAALHFECAVVGVPVDGSLESYSEDKSSDFDVASDVDEDHGEEPFATLLAEVHPSEYKYCASMFSGDDQEVSALTKKLSHLDDHSGDTLLKNLSIVARLPRDLSPVYVLLKQYFELSKSRPTHHLPCRVTPKYDESIRTKFYQLLEACIFLSATALWSLLVAIPSKKAESQSVA